MIIVDKNGKIDIELTTKQTLFVESTADQVLFGGAAGGGKVLPLSSKLLTPFGWKLNKDIAVGDTVINPRTGGSATVIIAHPVAEFDTWSIYFENGDTVD